jgi:flagellar biosynthesis protein FlhG
VVSGKGGTGRSFVTANLGAAISSLGKKVLLLDLDLTKPNLHTFFKKFTEEDGLVSVLNEAKEEQKLSFKQTDVANLFLVPGSRYLNNEDLERLSQVDLLYILSKEEADYIFIDMPSGWNRRILSWLVNPFKLLFIIEPTPNAIEAYYSLFKRILAERIGTAMNDSTASIIKKVVISPSLQDMKDMHDVYLSSMELLRTVLKQFRPAIIMNKARSLEDKQISETIAFLCKRQYCIDLDILGAIDNDDNIWQTVRNRQLIVTEMPLSVAARTIHQLAAILVDRDTKVGETR